MSHGGEKICLHSVNGMELRIFYFLFFTVGEKTERFEKYVISKNKLKYKILVILDRNFGNCSHHLKIFLQSVYSLVLN